MTELDPRLEIASYATSTAPNFPHHAPPQGLPVAHPTQAKVLFKAIKVLGRVNARPKARNRHGIQAPDTVRIRRKKPRFW